MIEVRCLTHITRLFAKETSVFDIFFPVVYFSFAGDVAKVPWYYKKARGVSAQSDLTKTIDDIMAGIKSNTRNEIRRAEKEGCVFEFVDAIEEFVPFYNAFCDSKGLNDYTSYARLKKYKHLLLTKVTHNGQTLAMHANILDPVGRIGVLIMSCSQRLDAGVDKKLIGWGNRYLHFKELEYLKQEGYEVYDWSGVVTDPSSPLYSIGQFKLAFGGKVVDSWVLQSPLYAMLGKVRDAMLKLRR